MKVLIRADASRALGTGHVMRELALAQALGMRGAEVIFASRALDGTAAKLVHDAGFALRDMGLGDDADEAADFAATADAAGGAYDWVVVDHYRLGTAWEREARSITSRVLAVDDLADRRHACDLLVDQNLYADADARYRNLVDPESTSLLGPAYAFLRGEFSNVRGSVRPRSGEVKRVLVSFGGSDPEGQTLIALDAFEMMGAKFAIDVVIGPANRDAAAIEARAARVAGAICHVAPQGIAALMASADLALGAGGVSTNERMCMGLPAALVATSALAEKSALDVERAGAHRYLGNAASMSAAGYADAIERLLSAPAALRAMSETGMRLVDGRGCERVADAMLGTSGIEPRQKLV